MEFHALQHLRIIDQDRIAPFEWDDGGRIDLSPEGPGILRDPLLVTPLEGDDFLLLDDSRTYYSLVDADFEHLPVQICTPVELMVDSDPLSLTRFTHDDLTRVLARFPDRIEILPAEKTVPDSPDHLDLIFGFVGAAPIRVRIRHSSLTGCPVPFDAVFRAILESGAFYPVVRDGGEGEWGDHSGPHSGTVSLPTFTLEDLRRAVSSGRLFPPGLIRVQAVCRVLNIDFPVPVLADRSTLEQKQAFLAELIALRARRRRIACFDGRVYMLNR